MSTRWALTGRIKVRVSETLSLPSWSPDGRRVALVAPEEVGAALYTFAADGSDPVRVAGIVGLPEERRFGGSEWPGWVGSVSWSPDGSEILVGPTVVRLDGSEPPRALPLLGPTGGRKEAMDGLLTSWSPDGSRIAVQTEQAGPPPSRGDGWPLLYTVDRDGTNPRVLVMEVIESDGDGHVTGWDPMRPPADVEACSSGEVVPDPEGNSWAGRRLPCAARHEGHALRLRRTLLELRRADYGVEGSLGGRRAAARSRNQYRRRS